MDRIEAGRLERVAAPATARRYRIEFAHGESARREAQKLRWKVFAEEMGARLASREHGVDHDIFDPYCEHLLCRDEITDEVVGTYRLLPPAQARRIGCYYSETEFDLTRLQLVRDRMVELGRSCIHPDHRTGAVIALLWSGLARYMMENGHDYLAGCASMSMTDGGAAAASVYERLAGRLAPPEYRVFPRCRLPLEELARNPAAEPPPLLKGYVRAGAWLCGEPAWDPDFNTADFFIFLPLARVESRYARHFFGAAAA